MSSEVQAIAVPLRFPEHISEKELNEPDRLIFHEPPWRGVTEMVPRDLQAKSFGHHRMKHERRVRAEARPPTLIQS